MSDNQQDTGFLPPVTQTVDMGGAGEEVAGDPLELMQEKARNAIDFINKKDINDQEKKKFKVQVLKKIKVAIDELNKIDKEKEEAQGAAAEEEAEVEDSLDDLFEDPLEPDEYMQRKMKVAKNFIGELKIFKDKFLKGLIKLKEKAFEKAEKKAEEDILKQLENM